LIRTKEDGKKRLLTRHKGLEELDSEFWGLDGNVEGKKNNKSRLQLVQSKHCKHIMGLLCLVETVTLEIPSSGECPPSGRKKRKNKHPNSRIDLPKRHQKIELKNEHIQPRTEAKRGGCQQQQAGTRQKAETTTIRSRLQKRDKKGAMRNRE